MAYNSYPHDKTAEVEKGRKAMLRIRCWELDLVYSSLLSLSRGGEIPNLAREPSDEVLRDMFKDRLEMGEGQVFWAGHSFGGSSAVQFLKSVYYHTVSPDSMLKAEKENGYNPLFIPQSSSEIYRQVTRESRMVLCDAWVFPLTFTETKTLNDLPLPCFDGGPAARGKGGKSILALESGEFFRWRKHLIGKKRFMSPDPTNLELQEGRVGDNEWKTPYFFYIPNSAHFSQSDWGVLFPWLCKKAFGATEGQRTMRLNVAAAVEFLSKNGVAVDGPVEVLELKYGESLLDKNADVRGWEWVDMRLSLEEIEELRKGE